MVNTQSAELRNRNYEKKKFYFELFINKKYL